MSIICEFDRILKTKCNLLHFTGNRGIKNLDDFEGYEADTHLWGAELLNVKEKGMTMFGNVFGRRESKCCGVLMKNCLKVKGEQLITLQMV